jgi:nicotinate-nucleotide adenylyltransferase
VFGGSFNPPHVAHLFAVVYALATAPIDRVLVIPVFRHPFAKELASFADRLEMCRLALGWIPGVELSTVEQELGGESLTLRTVEHLSARHPAWSLRLLVGADVLPELPKWHRWGRIAAIAPPLVLGRCGGEPPDHQGAPAFPPGSRFMPPACHGELPDEPSAVLLPLAPPPLLPQVSSTEIREAIVAGNIEAVRDRVPSAVLEYIVAHGLYAAEKE